MNCSTMAQTPVRAEPLVVLGTRVDMVTLAEAVSAIDGWIHEGAHGRYVIATGMHGVIEGYRDPNFRRILNDAGLFVPDGYSLVWLARRRGIPARQRVCGSELLWAFCGRAAEAGYRMFFYGDTEIVLARLVEKCRRAWPGIQIVGTYSPPFRALTPEEDQQVVARINAARPDVVWVGLGLPKQERWIVAHRDRVAAPAFVAVGAAFKLLSGDVRRAPRWVGDRGLEWIWRFAHEPRRLWRRTFIDAPTFAWLSLLELAGFLQVPIERVDRGERSGRRDDALKRAFDVVVALAGLVVSLPLWALFALLIKLEDRGPVFYGQERVGREGVRFRSWKFRTMVHDADARFGPLQASELDPRVTRCGRWLRATALDELPQLWNILRGDMSFVGPRALAPGEVEVGAERYVPIDAIPRYRERHQVQPGLTGVAQIYAPRDLPRCQKFRYDLLYILRRNFWMDLRLIGLSFWITFRGRWESRTKKF